MGQSIFGNIAKNHAYTPTGAFVSGETIMTATMATGYTVTLNNVAVKVNDSVVGIAGRNMMADAMGQENYQQFKDVSAAGSNMILMLGLSNPRLYGTNNNNTENIRENASYGSKQRPTWRESESDAAKDYSGYSKQKSFINGEECSYGTK